MHPLKAIRTLVSVKLLMKIATLLTAGVVLSGTVFYLIARKILLSPSYGEIVANVEIYKDMVLSRSIFIYAIFTILTLIGIVILSVIYSHRIAGPLQRVKAVSRELAKGNFDINVRLRKHDVIHPLADSINHMAEQYKARYTKLKDVTLKMAENIPALEVAIRNGDRDLVDKVIISLSEASSEIEETLSKMKL